MEKLTISKVLDFAVYGVDEDGVEVLVTKTDRVGTVKVGDEVLGHYLNEDDDDSFYFEVATRP